ncbi:DNA replication and repair protein RecF [Clostridium acetobutylicum]|uniref:DNA replication and repair protein RecF n=2 Tax=Clostridium acetobutylicum TaxID=1488 RepID=RECF_CLOAB|nr:MULTISPECIES: DNA replication/repair protein RecF [Clostridium]Q97N32.1 RecName: Full=DNA replication and repair protein RecF [Clostridium acetobutylicum ATCC 824]AAK77991.1 RecF, ABC family ATPase [Clostridium acetobutylicum ATCC 824]ADZ19047.1 recombination protein F [Clostridium acetobutylicum EA 2018]AEI33926.1 recombination protein F [Clostridium acetobutylicum DSM 1731]AWV80663.1 DNA replication/repair protein RecF [Clostridium acetobutylicum]MBC2394014.1 DNA replication/repair prote
MYIKNLYLDNFRNYDNIEIDFNKKVNILTGNNAQGKTNILESIFYCSLGKSHRTNKDKELIKWDKDEAFIRLNLSRKPLDKKIEIKIFKGGKKGININSIKLKKISELFGIFNVVMFSPEDLKIVKESPGHRRKFLDMEISKLDHRYYYKLVQYNKILDQRNIMLRNKKFLNNDMISVYDEQLSKFGSSLIESRIKYLNKLNEKGKIIHSDITKGKEEIEFTYLTHVKGRENISEELFSLFKDSYKRDVEKGNTSVGPHRDDFSIKINGIDARSFGSQGQQRTSVLTIKFASIQIIKEISSETPVLLLDDVLSELDESRQEYILNSLEGIQTLITCTGIGDIEKYLKNDFNVFRIDNGRIAEY